MIYMILDLMSLIGSYFVVFSLLYLVLFYTIGRLDFMLIEIIDKIYLGDILLPTISILIIIFLIDVPT